MTPANTFFENNLNTVTLPNGEKLDFLEKLYAEMESKSWESLDAIRNSTYKSKIDILTKMQLFLFISYLHWRLPSNISVLEKLSEEAFKDDADLDFIKLVNKKGEEAPNETKETIRNSSAFKTTVKLIAPLAPFHKDPDWAAHIVKWRFSYTKDEKSWNMVGDNPIITKGENDHDPINCLKEFIFPVSGNILLINIPNPPEKELPPEFILQFNISIIQRSHRFIACKDRPFLEAMIMLYKEHVRYGHTETIITDMFRMLEQ